MCPLLALSTEPKVDPDFSGGVIQENGRENKVFEKKEKSQNC